MKISFVTLLGLAVLAAISLGLTRADEAKKQAEQRPACGQDRPTAEPTEPQFAYACPVFPVMKTANGTMYYCDYFVPGDEDCQDPEAHYILGDANWPWQVCREDCIEVVYEAADTSTTIAFPGLSYKVSLNYLHKHEHVELLGQKVGQTRLPRGPGLLFCRVHPDRHDDFVSFRLGKEERDRYAKRIEFRVTKQVGGRDVVRFVAFEVETEPGDSRPVRALEAVGNMVEGNYFAYRTKFEGKPLLILLARESAQ